MFGVDLSTSIRKDYKWRDINYFMTREEDLEKLGFSSNETRVYLTLLKIGSSLAGKIAKEANLDRSSTYAALKLLQKRGIISTYFENKRTIFVPEDPKKIVDYFAEKQEIAKNVIINLKENISSESSQVVKLYRGYKGLKTVFNEILNECNSKIPLSILGAQGQFSEKMPYYSPIFRKLKQQKSIRTKVISKKLPLKLGKFTEYKILPSEVDSPATINIYANKIALFLWEDIPQAIVIDNPKLARTFENYFQFMWKKLK